MKINTNAVSLRISAGRMDQFPRNGIPQVAFSGRSNVGKSSLINTLLGRKTLARVSSTPGKTITINFYDIDKQLFLVDLPGYGYAQRGGDNKRQWSTLTDAYFTKNPNRDLLKLVVQLVDVRVGLTNDDVMMVEWLLESETPFVIVATIAIKIYQTVGLNKSEIILPPPFLQPFHLPFLMYSTHRLKICEYPNFQQNHKTRHHLSHRNHCVPHKPHMLYDSTCSIS